MSEMKLTALMKATPGANRGMYEHVLRDEEEVLMEFKSLRDILVITNHKMIAISVQGITGKKKEVMVLPYSKMTAYAVESSGTFDFDAELKVWSSGIGCVEFQFIKGSVNVRDLAHILADKIV